MYGINNKTSVLILNWGRGPGGISLSRSTSILTTSQRTFIIPLPQNYEQLEPRVGANKLHADSISKNQTHIIRM